MAICSRYGCPAEPFEVVAYQARQPGVMPSYFQARSQVSSPKLESKAFQAALHFNFNLQGEELM